MIRSCACLKDCSVHFSWIHNLLFSIDTFHWFEFSSAKMISNENSGKPRLIPSVRFCSALLVSFALFVQYSQRVGLSMAIVCMVDRTGSRQNLNTTVLSTETSTVKLNLDKIGNSIVDDRRFKWTEFEEQILLGAYWFGYIFTLVPGNFVFFSDSRIDVLTELIFSTDFRWFSFNSSWTEKNVRHQYFPWFYSYSGHLCHLLAWCCQLVYCFTIPYSNWFRSWSSVSSDVYLLVTMGCTFRKKYSCCYWLL